MTFTLSPATVADVPGMIDTWYAANRDSKNMQVFTTTPGMVEYFTECYTRSIEEDQDAVMVMTEETEGGKRRVGAYGKLCLEKGGQPFSDWRARWKAEFPEAVPKETVEAFWAALTRQRAVVMGSRAHWCKKHPFLFSSVLISMGRDS
jgi:hypothetical protein